MEYTSLDKMPYFTDCEKLVAGLGYALVELRVVPNNTQYQIRAVITHSDSANTEGIGINDCAKVHRLLLPRFEALLKNPDVYMEVTSPGMERTIKNAAEFALFVGQTVRLWDTNVYDWVSGVLISSTQTSVTIRLLDGNQEKELPYDQIAKAKLLHT